MRPCTGAAGALVVAALVASGCATRPPARKTTPAEEVFESLAAPTPGSQEQAAPRWEHLTTLSGTGDSETPGFRIAKDAVQWKIQWRCETGRLVLSLVPPPLKKGPLSENACPGEGVAYAVRAGPARIIVGAQGPWELEVLQQVTSPLEEAPLPEMAPGAAPLLAGGEFYPLERQTSGRASVFDLGGGRLALRLDGFRTSNNTDLFVWASEAQRPGDSAQAAAAQHVVLGGLKSTIGSHNYVVEGLDPARFRSVVIWCQPVQIAYGAAELTPRR